jgi:hypothetical protein
MVVLNIGHKYFRQHLRSERLEAAAKKKTPELIHFQVQPTSKTGLGV